MWISKGKTTDRRSFNTSVVGTEFNKDVKGFKADFTRSPKRQQLSGKNKIRSFSKPVKMSTQAKPTSCSIPSGYVPKAKFDQVLFEDWARAIAWDNQKRMDELMLKFMSRHPHLQLNDIRPRLQGRVSIIKKQEYERINSK